MISLNFNVKFEICINVLSQAQVHRAAQNFRVVQQCTLLSIKTGGCSEDCSYCPQSSRYDTGLKAQRLMNKDAVIEAAKKVPSLSRSLSLLFSPFTGAIYVGGFQLYCHGSTIAAGFPLVW